MLFSSRLTIRIRFSVWLVRCYAHVFVYYFRIAIVTMPIFGDEPVTMEGGGRVSLCARAVAMLKSDEEAYIRF